MRSFLKWAGSKYTIREHIIQKLPEGKRLIEPFTGSASIFLNSHYSEYLLGEKNQDLVDLYQLLQKEGVKFVDDCKEYFILDNNCPEKYLQFREKFNETLNKPRKKKQRALLFLYLNRHCYNGLCRYNNKGIFNVPFGQYHHPKLPEKNMLYFHEKSQQAIFAYADFRTLLKQAKSGDVIYCDPPYVPLSNTAYFSKYLQGEFSSTDQQDLADIANNLSKKNIPVILSNHDTLETREYYKNAKIIALDVQRRISCSVNNRKKAAEIIAVF